MEEDILNYSPTVMFRGTPCIKSINVKMSMSGLPLEQAGPMDMMTMGILSMLIME